MNTVGLNMLTWTIFDILLKVPVVNYFINEDWTKQILVTNHRTFSLNKIIKMYFKRLITQN